MMRLLLCCQPVRSHLHSLMPVAMAARRLGHTVGLASGSALEPFAHRAGFDFIPCGLDLAAASDPMVGLAPEMRAALASAPLVVQHLVGFSAGLAPAFARDLMERGPAWAPDLLLREPVEFGSPIVAERWGIPCASVMWAVYISPRYLMRDAYAGVCTDFGLDPDAFIEGFDEQLVVRYLPSSWRIEPSFEPGSVLPVAAHPFDGGDGRPLPEWMASLPGRPTVYVTLGLSFSHAPDVFRAIVAGLDGLDANVIVTVGTSLDRSALEPVPDNVRVERYIPGGLLLPHCDAVVFHGGFNTLHSVLWHGLPSVVFPLEGGDQAPTAERIEALGLGLRVAGPEPSPEVFRSAIERVLEEPTFGEAARRFQQELRGLPPVEAAVERMETLVGA